MSKARFSAELIEGHKGVTAAVIPIDPEAVWKQRPVKLDLRREGWLIRGTAKEQAKKTTAPRHSAAKRRKS